MISMFGMSSMSSTLNTTAVQTIRTLALAGACLAGAPIASAQDQPPPGLGLGVPKVSSSWTITRSQNGRNFTVSGVDGKLSGSVDGRPVPADRLKSENGKISILDDAGAVIFEQDAPESGLTILGGEGDRAAERPDTRFSRPGGRGAAGPGRNLFPNQRGGEAAKVEPPAVMVGVQLVEPDSVIRGHFGLKEGDATMVAAVYDGLAAQKAGLKPYDLIVSIDGKSPASANTVREAFRSRQPGQAIAVEVLHRGEKKSISISPEKYDAAKMDDAKVDAIVTADDWGNLSRQGNNLGFINGQPFVMTLPAPGARGQTLLGPEHQAIQRQAEEWARRLQQQGVAPGNAGLDDLNKAIEDRMRRMEEMMRQMIERQNVAPGQNAQPPKKDEKTSRRDGRGRTGSAQVS